MSDTANLKVLWGNVNADGTTHTGRGFEVRHLGKGLYEVDFADGTFTQVPGFTAIQVRSWDNSAYSSGNTKDNCVLMFLSTSVAKVKTGDQNGDGSNRNFSFIATGI